MIERLGRSVKYEEAYPKDYQSVRDACDAVHLLFDRARIRGINSGFPLHIKFEQQTKNHVNQYINITAPNSPDITSYDDPSLFFKFLLSNPFSIIATCSFLILFLINQYLFNMFLYIQVQDHVGSCACFFH